MKKKFSTLLLSLALLFFSAGTPLGMWRQWTSSAELVDSGTCGDELVNEGKNVTWKLETNGGKVTVGEGEVDAYTLTISGTGAMKASLYSCPWADYASAITSVVVENGVTSLSAFAFQSCSALSSVSLPASLAAVGAFALGGGGYALETLSLAAGNAVFEVSNNGALLAGKDGTLVVYAMKNSNEHLVVPKGVKDIPAQFFNTAQNVTSVSLPATVETIGFSAFSNMPGVKTLVLPPSVTSVGSGVFGSFLGESFIFYKSGLSLPSDVSVSTDTVKLAYTVEGAQDGKTAVKITSASKAATVCNNAMGPDYVITGSTAGNVTFQSGHTWDAARYECSDCASTGSCEHVWVAATCTTPKTCSVCGETEGSALDHDMAVATCTEAATCQRAGCNYTEGSADPDAHEWDEGTITKQPTCTEKGVKTFTCKHNAEHTDEREVPIDPDAHDLSDVVISEPTAEKLGEVHSMCSRCDYDVFSHYTLGDGTSPTMYPDGTRISDASYTPKAGGPFNLNGQEIEILLQDPLGVLGSGTLGLSVEQIDLPADFDGDVDVEHSHSYDIFLTVDGVKKSGKLSNKVRLLYKIPQGWDRADLEVFLAQMGPDREFDERTEKIGDDEYLVIWTDHFSPYVFVDKLNPEEKAALKTLQDESGNGQTNGNNSAKTGDASGEILMLSALAMIATGLYLGLFLKKRKSF